MSKVRQEHIEKFAGAMARLSQALKNEAEACGLMCGGASEKELMVIFYVGQHGNVKMSDIADNVAAPLSTISSIVEKLVEKNALHRDHSGEDRRVINVSLAENGKLAYARIMRQKLKLAKVILSNLEEPEQPMITRHIEQIVDSLNSLH